MVKTYQNYSDSRFWKLNSRFVNCWRYSIPFIYLLRIEDFLFRMWTKLIWVLNFCFTIESVGPIGLIQFLRLWIMDVNMVDEEVFLQRLWSKLEVKRDSTSYLRNLPNTPNGYVSQINMFLLTLTWELGFKIVGNKAYLYRLGKG